MAKEILVSGPYTNWVKSCNRQILSWKCLSECRSYSAIIGLDVFEKNSPTFAPALHPRGLRTAYSGQGESKSGWQFLPGFL
jgi:hypothetical protein